MSDETKTPYQLTSPDSTGASNNLLEEKNQKEALNRIQALLADWFRMENLVVLTGAGTSFSAGGKLMSGEDSLEKQVLTALEKSEHQLIKDITADRNKEVKSGKISFEEWLSYIFRVANLPLGENCPISEIVWKGVSQKKELPEGQSELQPINKGNTKDKPSPETQLKEALDDIEKTILKECSLKLPDDQSSGHIPFLAKLIARDPNLGRTHLFTLNYDTLFEQAMDDLRIHYADGFTGKVNARFDPSVYGLDLYYPGDVSEGRVRRYDKFLHFYKLHGSVHWRIDEKGETTATHDKIASPQNRLGIMPTSGKFTDTLNMPYAHLFRLFHARLSQPQTFFIVAGYGFGDNHVNEIISTALMNPSLVMLVVAPSLKGAPEDFVRKYQKAGARVFTITKDEIEGKTDTATFKDFAENILPNVQWLEDHKRLRKIENEIYKIKSQDKGEE